MRKVLILVLLFLLLAACGGNEDAVEETQAELPTLAAEAPPRVEATPTATLPPTFTPPAADHGGHVFAVRTSAIHVVQPGDTLGELATRYGVTVEDIARANRITDIDRIEVGTVLLIPSQE